MRRPVESDGRTTVYVTDREVWDWAKETASARKMASVSELLFEALGDAMRQGTEERLLRCLEKWCELGHFTLAAVADGALLPREKVLGAMRGHGIDPDEGGTSRAREQVHRLLRRAGLAPGEDVILARMEGRGAVGLGELRLLFDSEDELGREL